ncbi:MAG: cytochrome c oxidase subunit II [Alphaproteobacteria bacterium]|nr:cytochrome c oxidase subunit II [Alphaproteobacteria bacterium]
MRIAKIFAAAVAILTNFGLASVVWASDGLEGLPRIGKPIDGAMGFQPGATEVARDVHWLDQMIFVIIVGITIFVTALLIWIIIRYRKSVNPTPSTFTHNSAVEVVWTIVPILILIVIGVFSLPVLFKQMEIPKADITIKVTGNQWFWSYEYVGTDISFDAFMLQRDELKASGYAPDEYLLAADNALVVPVNKNVVLQITGADVIHSWAMPAFGVKLDAVPGRTAETWFNVDPGMEGIYFGQCSELCGKDHAYMPITVKVVSQEVYDKWLIRAEKEFASLPKPVLSSPLSVASN